MRKIFVVIVLYMLSVSLMGAESKRFEVTPLFSFDYLKAGDGNVPLIFRIDNRSNLTLENIYARIVLSFPFSPSTLARKELRSDMYKLDDIESYTSKNALFKIDVSKSAKYGDYIMQIVVSYDDPQDPMYRIEETFPFSIHVTGETLVEVSDFIVGKEGTAFVGEDFLVAFNVNNEGENRLEWLKVNLLIDDPAIVLREGSLKVFEGVRGKSRTGVSFSLTIDNNATPRNYILKILIEYKDERRETGNEEITSGIKVLGAPKLAIGGKTLDPAIISAGKDFTLTLKIDNTGSEIAEGVKVILDTGFEGDHEAYLGKIERDDYANAIFILKSQQEGQHEVRVKIFYEFSGSEGTHSNEEVINLLVRPDKTFNYLPVVAAVAALIVLIVAFRILRKK
jgi:hypothetical protein